jgi:hypothetical protein
MKDTKESMKNALTTFSVLSKYRGGLDRILLDGIQKTRGQINALESSKEHFKGDVAQLSYKKGLLVELERLYER